MARKSQEQLLSELHEQALKDFNNIQANIRQERMMCLQDRRFYSVSGAQWEGPLSDQFANKPRFEVNKCHLAVLKIVNEYRNNRIGVTFIPKDGTKHDELADAVSGLHRSDEQDSSAEDAYDNAFEEACSGGFGAWRLRTEYEDEEDDDDERQRIRIEPIFDADSTVFFDLNSKRMDKADAMFAYVLIPMTWDAYKAEWHDDPATWPKAITQSMFDWYVKNDVVWVAEYYKVEYKKETIHVYRGLDGKEEKYTDDDIEEDAELLDRLKATGFREVRQKSIKRRRVRKYIMSGGSILEDCGYIAGKHIPIIPAYGKRWVVDGVERCMGHIRMSKDVQRLKNMQLSRLGEISAYSPIKKPIVTPEQINGHAVTWAEDPVKNNPFLLINAVSDGMGSSQPMGPVGYLEPPDIPPAMGALLEITEKDMQDLLGSASQANDIQSNISGIAVELQQSRIDMQTYIYMSNFAKAKKRSAEVWLSMAREILVETGRKMKVVQQNGEIGSVELRQPSLDDDGLYILQNNLDDADFDVVAEVGPTSVSRRNAAARSIVEMMKSNQDPETAQVLTYYYIMNTEGEGISDLRGFFRKKLLAIGAVDPTEEEQKEIAAQAQNAQQQPPDAQTLYLQSAAAESNAKAEKAKADTVLTSAKAEQTKAETANLMATMTREQQTHIADMIDRVSRPAETTQPLNMGEQGEQQV